MGNVTGRVDRLQEARTAKPEMIVCQDGARVDFRVRGKDSWERKHLSLNEMEKLTDPFFFSVLDDKMTSIDIARCESLTDESIKAIAQGCPKLKELNVSCVFNLTDESIKAIAEGCPALKELNVSECENLTDESIKAIARGCRKLKQLDVRKILNITDEGIKAIANSCPALKELNVSECNLTDESIKAIAMGCPKLEELNVSFSKRLTDESIKEIALRCPNLKELNVSECENLTDESIKAIARGCRKLKQLDVRKILNITDEGIKAIANCCPLLRQLHASECSLKSLPNDIGNLLPKLQLLDISYNNLTTLPRSIVDLKSLQDPCVSGNPLLLPPYGIAKDGLVAIERYFKKQEKDSRISRLLKVVIVGDGEAGKTSLRYALAGRSYPRQAKFSRTTYVDIEKINLDVQLDINVYDSGGQQVYLSAQLPYLTDLALYMVVVEAQYATNDYADVVEEKLHRFLVVLQNVVPGAVVLPIVTKVDTVTDPESRCHWLEKEIGKWLQDTREAMCGSMRNSSSNRPQPAALLASVANADGMRNAGKSCKQHFMPLRVQWPALAVSVANTGDIDAVLDSVCVLRDRIIALAKHDPPLLRVVGQQIPSEYLAVLRLLGAIAEYGDNARALNALRSGKAHPLGEIQRFSPFGACRPVKELSALWKMYLQDLDVEDAFDNAIQFWEAQGLIFVDAGLVVLQPQFITEIVKPLVDHRLDHFQYYERVKDRVAQFRSSSLRDYDHYRQLIDALDDFIASGEFENSEEPLLLSHLWRNTGLDKGHYSQVLQMLADFGFVLKVKRVEGDRGTVMVVPFRLPRNPDEIKLEKFWPKNKPSKQRELALRFEPRLGFPAGLVERFLSDVYRNGMPVYSWRSGVVVGDSAGYSALAERRENVLHFTVRFEADSTEYEVAAWNAIFNSRQMLAAQCESRFPGLFYEECFTCEECCRKRIRPVATVVFEEKRRKSVFGHCLGLDSRGKDEDRVILHHHFEGAIIIGSQIVGVAGGDANYHSESPGVS